MKRTCALVIVSLPLVPSVIDAYSRGTAQVATSMSLLLRAAAIKPYKSIDQVPFTTIAKGSLSGVRETSQFAVRSQSEWQTLWRQHTSTSTVPAALPTIDFDKQTVAAVFLGHQPTGGYGIEIVGAELTAGALNILFRETTPSPGAIVTQAFTQPFHIIRIEVNGIGSISFRRLQ